MGRDILALPTLQTNHLARILPFLELSSSRRNSVNRLEVEFDFSISFFLFLFLFLSV